MSRKTISIGDKIYIVEMDRRITNHSYVLGVYKSKSKAIAAGENERIYRGGTKYIPAVWEMELGHSIDDYRERIA